MPRKDLNDLTPDTSIIALSKGKPNISGTIRNLHYKLASENIEVRSNASQVASYLIDCGVATLYYGSQNQYRHNLFSKVVTSALNHLERSGEITKDSGHNPAFHLGYATKARENEEIISRHNGYAMLDEYVDILTRDEYTAILNYVIFGNPNGYGGESRYHGEQHLESARDKVKQARGKEG